MTTRLPIPFNIDLMQLVPADLARIRRVTSLSIFEGSSRDLDPEGLYSVTTFGSVGTDTRLTRFGYIDLKISILHPTVYQALVGMRGFYRDIMAGKEFAKWDDNAHDFVRSNVVDGQTGYEFFMSRVKQIEFEQRPSVKREQAIRLLAKFKERMTTDKVLVIPAGLRDVEVDEFGRVTSDEINELYFKLLAISNTISTSAVAVSPESYNAQRYALQQTFNEVHEYLSRIVEGKKNLMMGKWASRKVNDGTRNVITAMDTKVTTIADPGNMGLDDTQVGIYQLARAMRPVTLYRLRNGFLSRCFVSRGASVRLCNPKTLKSEYVDLGRESYDNWMSNEGLEKYMAYFKEDSVRHNPVMIEGHYLGLVYRGPDKTFKFIHGLEDLPEGFDPKHCTPITNAELHYEALYPVASNYYGFVTRYPITGNGSVYPTRMYLMSTVKSERRQRLNDHWEREEGDIAYQFPVVGSAFFNSMAPHPSRLPRLGADFDGDTMSLTVLYMLESLEEVKAFLGTRKAYLASDGSFLQDFESDTIKYVLHNLTGMEP